MVYVLVPHDMYEAGFSCVLALTGKVVPAPERSRNRPFCVLETVFCDCYTLSLSRKSGHGGLKPMLLGSSRIRKRSKVRFLPCNHKASSPSQSGDRHSIRGCHRPHSRKTDSRTRIGILRRGATPLTVQGGFNSRAWGRLKAARRDTAQVTPISLLHSQWGRGWVCRDSYELQGLWITKEERMLIVKKQESVEVFASQHGSITIRQIDDCGHENMVIFWPDYADMVLEAIAVAKGTAIDIANEGRPSEEEVRISYSARL